MSDDIPVKRSEFDRWIEAEDYIRDWEVITPTDQMRLAWNGAVKECQRKLAELLEDEPYC